MEYEIFVRKWFERSERHNVPVDKVDKFIDLWIAFNGWMKSEFGESTPESEMIRQAGSLEDFITIFNEFKLEEYYKGKLTELKGFKVVNMKYPDNQTLYRTYDGDFNSLIKVLYSIRCNLFHGRKNVKDNEIDQRLVYLAYDLLLPLFKKYMGY